MKMKFTPFAGWARQGGVSARLIPLLLSLLLLPAGCSQSSIRVPVLKEISLIDLFPKAILRSKLAHRKPEELVSVRTVTVGTRSGRAIVQNPAVSVRYRLSVPPGAVLRFSTGMPVSTWNRSPDGVGFHIHARPVTDPVSGAADKAKRSPLRPLFNFRLKPKSVHAHRRIFDHQVDLTQLDSGTWEFIFSLDHGPKDNVVHDTGFWLEPRLIHQTGTEKLQSPAPDRPNVLLITFDSLRADMLQPYAGGAPTEAPAISRLAAEGLTVAAAYTPSTFFMPSYASIITGRSPRAHGCHADNRRLDRRIPTAVSRFNRQGYATAAFTGSGRLAPRHSGMGAGFDRFDAPIIGRRDAKETVLAALEWLREHRRTPFFCWVQIDDLQPPFPISERDAFFIPSHRTRRTNPELLFNLDFFTQRPDLKRRWDRWLDDIIDPGLIASSYRESVARVDRQTARLLDELETAGLEHSTLVAICSNRGLPLGEGDTWCDWEGLGTEAVRVPMILRFPGRIPSGSMIPSSIFVSTADLMPTILSLVLPSRPGPDTESDQAGLSPAMDGRDLIPALHAGSNWSAAPVFLEGRTRRSNKPDFFAMLDGRLKLQANRDWIEAPQDFDSKELALYDLLFDPNETRNVKSYLKHRKDMLSMLPQLRLNAWEAISKQNAPS